MSHHFLILLLLSLTCFLCVSKADPKVWSFSGPETYVQSGDVTKMAGASATQIAVTSGGKWFIGTVNGGVWRSDNISVGTPHWQNVLDSQPVTCVSISAMFAVDDGKTIYAGCGGSTSSEMGEGWSVLNDGKWSGLMVSYDLGDSWQMLDNFVSNAYISSIITTNDNTRIIVSFRATKFEANTGGIMVSDDSGNSWKQVFTKPVYNLLNVHNFGVVAVLPYSDNDSVFLSKDHGDTWNVFSSGINWGDNMQPFYPCVAVDADSDKIYVGALTVSENDSTYTRSQIYSLSVMSGDNTWVLLPNQPARLDDDAMPKDRMALLVDPNNSSTLYVAGNGGQVAFRVDLEQNTWTDMLDADTTDNSEPHCDCRNFAWDNENQNLVLVSDGGIFMRTNPSVPKGGRWRSLNGDITAMEYLTAVWDYRNERFAAGAQDNCVQLSLSQNAMGQAQGWLFGDGTTTAVDNVINPARLFGTTQFLGVGDLDTVNKPHLGRLRDDYDAGFGFVYGSNTVLIPLQVWFKEASSFPFFVHPFGLNSQVSNTTQLVFWADKDSSNDASFWALDIPASIKSTNDLVDQCTPKKIRASNGQIYALVAGGFTNGNSDPNLLVAMNDTHLYRYANGDLTISDLPAQFAKPVVLTYENDEAVLGPLTHDKTVSLAVSPSNSALIAVTGYLSLDPSKQDTPEGIWITNDASQWKNVIGNLQDVSNTTDQPCKPSGLLFVDFDSKDKNGEPLSALLVGTITGVYVSWTDDLSNWERVGNYADMPLVMVRGLSYEHYSDILLAPTMGRGVFKIENAKQTLLNMRPDGDRWSTASSAKYYPIPK